MTNKEIAIGWLEKCRELWVKACEHDGIDPKSMFIVFTTNNPFQKEYNEAVRQFQIAKHSIQVDNGDIATWRKTWKGTSKSDGK